jgi:hypothetical protein
LWQHFRHAIDHELHRDGGAMTMAIEPGSASMGLPNGMMATSSLAASALDTSGLTRTRECCAWTMSSASRNSG